MRYFLFILTLLCAIGYTSAQQPGLKKAGAGNTYIALDKENLNSKLANPSLYDWVPLSSDSIRYYRQYIIVREKDDCKGYRLYYLVPQERVRVVTTVDNRGGAPIRKPFIKIHGNILYDLNYRSNIDTPYAEKDVYQHTIQTYLDVLVKDGYPFRVYITTHLSNSSFLRNYTDVSMQFNTNDFNNRVKRQAVELGLKQVIGTDSLAKLRKMLDMTEKQYLGLQTEINNPSQLQRLVEARERALMAKSHSMPAVTDSLTNADSLYANKRKQLDSLRSQLAALQKLYQQAQQWQGNSAAQMRKDIDGARSGTELKSKLDLYHIADSSLPKGYQSLLAVKSFGVGRTMVDYSELSAKNISVTGVQLEYNPSYYFAFAAGTVDYRFRDYIIRGAQKTQYLGLVRYGFGNKNGNNIIFTWYGGKRQLYNSATTVQGSTIPNYSLMGFTIEGRYQLNKTSYLTAEVAKSSSPYYSLDSTQSHNILGSTVKMDDHSNEAYSLQLNSLIRPTQTQLSGSYRHLGSNFQSFSLFTSGSAQSAWSARVDQPFFHKHLTVTGSIRTNDFTNPLINTTYSSNTVFKSIQATLRIKKWPTISVGYFPSSQLTKLSDTQYEENLFYTFTASATHVYRVKKTSLLTSVIYTQFYNKVTDTSFVYFNTKNLFVSQSAFVGNLTLQLNLSVAANTSYTLYVAENSVQYKLNKWLSLGAGIKYNQQTVYNILQWGYSGNARLRVPKVGEFQLTADKGFIPGSNKQLVENKIGRLTYIKVF